MTNDVTPIAQTVPAAVPPTASAPSEHDISRALALLLEELISADEFSAMTGLDPAQLSSYLADQETMASVQRTTLEMRNSGVLDRLEALKHSRRGFKIAATMIDDERLSPTVKLGAVTLLARAAGTFEPADNRSGPAVPNIRIKISIGKPRGDLVIGTGAFAHEDTRGKVAEPIEGEFSVSPGDPPSGDEVSS